MAAGGISLRDKLPGIDTCPIFYISLHGSYDIQKYKSKIIPIEITVPDDIIVIETSNIGESCYFTNFRDAIFPLLSDRPRLLRYMAGNPPEDDTDEQKFKRANALNSCHIYTPGNRIPNRSLTQETGRRDGVHLETSVPVLAGARASEYGKFFRFTRHNVGARDPVPVLEDVHRRLIEESTARHKTGTLRANAWEKVEAYETYQSIFERINREGIEGLKILIFPVCGTIFPTNPKIGVGNDAEYIQQISTLQENSDKQWTRLIGGISLNAVSKAVSAGYRGPSGVAAGTQHVGRNRYSSSGVVPKRDGGSRRFVKKSKKTRRVYRAKKSL